eukprot:scaffold1459_cov104-Isochrysis_galbana.AAC.8
MGVVYFELCLVYVLARSQALDRHWPRLDPCLALVLDPAVAAAPRLDRSGLRKGRLCALLLRYVVICQCNGLMPIVEPEVRSGHGGSIHHRSRCFSISFPW